MVRQLLAPRLTNFSLSEFRSVFAHTSLRRVSWQIDKRIRFGSFWRRDGYDLTSTADASSQEKVERRRRRVQMWGARGARLWVSLKRMGKEGTSRGESWKSMFTAPEAVAIAAQDYILEGARSGPPVQQHLLREVLRSVGLAGRANGQRQTAHILQQRLVFFLSSQHSTLF
jgi:hypothetical protein